MFLIYDILQMLISTKVMRGVIMDGLLFLCFWLGGAILHTLYDLKIKHILKSEKQAEQSS